jgi:ArsR family transcriptional regulator, arsenate/arsenite/antimonite-responsive transcriptional repressor
MSLQAKVLDVRSMSRLFKALGDETRLRVVALLAHGELCVCHIEEALEISQPNASRQLSILKNAGVVDSKRNGNWVYYALAEQEDEDRRLQLRTLVRSFAKQDVLRRDVEKLVRIRGPKSCP